MKFKIMIMEKHENISLALAVLEKNVALNLEIDHDLAWVISRNKVLFWAVEPWLAESWTQKDLDNIIIDLDKKEHEVQVDIYRNLTNFLYLNGLTKINLRKVRSGPPNAELENMEDEE